MSEEQEVYMSKDGRKIELQFMSKRLVDFTKDFEKLDEEEKKFVIERTDKLFGYGLVDLYNSLLEYM